MNPHFNKCFNVTLDNTSLLLTERILSKYSKIVGTVRKDRCEITNSDAELKKSVLYSSEINSNEYGCSLTNYKEKKKKNVYLMSELHPKILPQTSKFYNETKFGGQIMNQMKKYHTCKTRTRRWPVACFFFNLLDLCAINFWILYKEIIDSSIGRKGFMLKLINQLCLQEVAVIENATKNVPQNSVN